MSDGHGGDCGGHDMDLPIVPIGGPIEAAYVQVVNDAGGKTSDGKFWVGTDGVIRRNPLIRQGDE